MFLAVSFFFVAEDTREAKGQDDFPNCFQIVNALRIADVGRQTKVAGYEQLLDDFPDDPRRVKVMLALSSLWENSLPQRGIYPDYEISIEWLREASSVGEKGSDDWVKAQFYLAARVRRETPDQARTILKEIDDATTDNVTAIKVLYDLQKIEDREGNFEKAEEICLRIQCWTDDPSRVPEKMFDKGKVYGTQQSSARSMMTRLLHNNQPHEENLAKFQKIVDAHGTQFNRDLLREMRGEKDEATAPWEQRRPEFD